MKDLRIKRIIAEPLPGGHVRRCLELSINLSKQYTCKVEFEHNGIKYLVDEDGNYAKLN